MEYFSHVNPDTLGAPTVTHIRMPSLEAIDQASSVDERRRLIAARLQGENEYHQASGFYYAVSGIYLRDLPQNAINNLLESHETQRTPISCQLFAFDGQTYVGYIDLTVHCLGVTRHNANHDIHRAINRHNCFDIAFKILTFEPHFVSDCRYPEDATRFLEASTEYTIIYSPDIASSRLTCSGPFHHFVPPLLAAFDGLVPPGILNTCRQSSTQLNLDRFIDKLA